MGKQDLNVTGSIFRLSMDKCENLRRSALKPITASFINHIQWLSGRTSKGYIPTRHGEGPMMALDTPRTRPQWHPATLAQSHIDEIGVAC